MKNNLFKTCIGFCAHKPENSAKAPILSEFPLPKHDLIFIRHAESIFNMACENYRKTNNIPYVWRELCNHEGFDQTVLFNAQFIDCPITEKGKVEAQKTKNLMRNAHVDCIIVSPQLRALQTCQNIFQNQSIPTFVEPLFVGPLRSCSDVNKSIKDKKVQFPNYDFTPTEEYQQLWYLDYLSPDQIKVIEEKFKEKNITMTAEKRIEIVQLLRERRIFEGPLQYRKRIQLVKNKIREYRLKYNKIAIVSHYYTIEYLCAMDYMECGTPHYYIDIKNCTPYYAALADLMSIKEEI